jgi:hypothetical protein
LLSTLARALLAVTRSFAPFLLPKIGENLLGDKLELHVKTRLETLVEHSYTGNAVDTIAPELTIVIDEKQNEIAIASHP